MLLDSVTHYMSRLEYGELVSEVTRKFPGFAVDLPSQENAAKERRESSVSRSERPDRSYWFLQASIDLDIPEVTN